MAKPNPNLLMVEGKDEQYTLPYLLDNYVDWGDTKDEWVAEIKKYDGVDNLLERGVIKVALKTPGLKALGLIVDADHSLDSRWRRVRDRCREVAADFPEEPTPGGVVHVMPTGLRIGVWLMPDNRSRGMMETFLSSLVVPDRVPLWERAREACDRVVGIEGCYSESHRDKARIHTYLAWIEPPGLSLSTSVLRHAFDARLPLAKDFARWFMALFEVPPRDTPAGSTGS